MNIEFRVYVVQVTEWDRMSNDIKEQILAFGGRDLAERWIAEDVERFERSDDYEPERMSRSADFPGYVEIQDDECWTKSWTIHERTLITMLDERSGK